MKRARYFYAYDHRGKCAMRFRSRQDREAYLLQHPGVDYCLKMELPPITWHWAVA